MELVFATNNQHKLQELRQIVGDRFTILSLSDIGCHADIPETGATLQENALIKARYVHDRFGCNCFADDTGLEVDALNGAPGVFTARFAEKWGYAAPGATPADANNDLLLSLLAHASTRTARFRTAIALIINGEEHLFEGVVDGTIATERHGAEGFGYDPVFIPQGWDCTFAEASAEQKNSVSHRGRAVAALNVFLNTISQ